MVRQLFCRAAKNTLHIQITLCFILISVLKVTRVVEIPYIPAVALTY